jgi:hypothetical protein
MLYGDRNEQQAFCVNHFSSLFLVGGFIDFFHIPHVLLNSRKFGNQIRVREPKIVPINPVAAGLLNISFIMLILSS